MNEVGMEQIAYTFDALTLQNGIRKEDKKWISYQCEVACRQKIYDCPGVEMFNKELKIKHMPFL